LCQTLTLFQGQVVKASFTSRWLNVGFHAQVAKASKQINMETCCVSMTTRHSFWLVEIACHKTWTSKLSTQRNMSSFSEQPNTHFDARITQAPKTYPTKTCVVLGTMFQSHPPISHVPPCNLHPWPMTHPWHFRPFSTFPHFV
jgi:hypothetical protein